MRPRKKSIQLDKSSMRDIMQEIYNESVEQRSLGIREANKILEKVDDLSDVQQVGQALSIFLKLADAAIDKKIQLAKLQQSVLVGASSEQDKTTIDSLTITDDDKKRLQELMQNIKKEKKGEE